MSQIAIGDNLTLSGGEFGASLLEVASLLQLRIDRKLFCFISHVAHKYD